MIAIRRILCPIDFSEFSQRALDHAVAIAKCYGSTVTLLHVVSPAPVAAYDPGAVNLPSAVLTPEDREALAATMKRFAETEAGASVPMRFEIREGNTAAEVLAQASAIPVAELLVMGTHGRSGFERLMLGSVTEKVLRKAMCPVLSVPSSAPDAVPAPPALFTRILCAIDFSDCSMQALDYAMSLAQQTHARLTVLHALEPLPELSGDVHETIRGGPGSMQAYIAAAEQDRRARLESAIPESVRASCTVDTLMVHGKPYSEILRVAAEQQSDLIVIGIHGRGVADLLFFGSTAQHVVRQASCPVLTLRR